MEQLNFWSAENMSEFWGYVEGLLKTVSPGVMIWFSLVAVGLLLSIIVKAWKQSANESDDDVEIKHY